MKVKRKIKMKKIHFQNLKKKMMNMTNIQKMIQKKKKNQNIKMKRKKIMKMRKMKKMMKKRKKDLILKNKVLNYFQMILQLIYQKEIIMNQMIQLDGVKVIMNMQKLILKRKIRKEKILKYHLMKVVYLEREHQIKKKVDYLMMMMQIYLVLQNQKMKTRIMIVQYYHQLI